jgi:hypothetical protein
MSEREHAADPVNAAFDPGRRRRRPRGSPAAASSVAPIARAPSSPRTGISLKNGNRRRRRPGQVEQQNAPRRILRHHPPRDKEHQLASRKCRRESTPQTNLLSPKSASGAGAFKTAYLAYSQFSGDAAHPSLTALARHWRRAEDRTVEVVVRPEVSQAELDQTLIFAGMAVLGLLGVIDEMFGHVAPSGTLVRLRDELQALQDEEAAVVAATPADAARTADQA